MANSKLEWQVGACVFGMEWTAGIYRIRRYKTVRRDGNRWTYFYRYYLYVGGSGKPTSVADSVRGAKAAAEAHNRTSGAPDKKPNVVCMRSREVF